MSKSSEGESQIPFHEDIEEVLISEADLAAKVVELGQVISREYQRHQESTGRALLLVCILKGAVMFLVDLARAISTPVEVDFMAVSSYGSSTESSGVVRIVMDLKTSIEGRDVLIVEDIVDSGLTLSYLLDILKKRNPHRIRVCALLDKTKGRQKEVELDYIGFTIPDRFVVGYGLDYAEAYRNLPYIGVLRRRVYEPNL